MVRDSSKIQLSNEILFDMAFDLFDKFNSIVIGTGSSDGIFRVFKMGKDVTPNSEYL
jgi:hypothetical protein